MMKFLALFLIFFSIQAHAHDLGLDAEISTEPDQTRVFTRAFSRQIAADSFETIEMSCPENYKLVDGLVNNAALYLDDQRLSVDVRTDIVDGRAIGPGRAEEVYTISVRHSYGKENVNDLDPILVVFAQVYCAVWPTLEAQSELRKFLSHQSAMPCNVDSNGRAIGFFVREIIMDSTQEEYLGFECIVENLRSAQIGWSKFYLLCPEGTEMRTFAWSRLDDISEDDKGIEVVSSGISLISSTPAYTVGLFNRQRDIDAKFSMSVQCF